MPIKKPADQTDYIEGFIDNIYEVISSYKEYLDLRAIYKTDDAFQAKFPSVTIEFDSAEEEWKRMPRVKLLTARFAITYYYENFNEKTLRTRVRQGLNNLATVLRENWDLNDYTKTHGSTIITITPYIIANGEDMIAGGQIILECRKEFTVTLQ